MASDVPAGLQARGVRLWRMFLAQDASMAIVDDPRREVALEACRVADRLERLNEICDRVDPIIETDKGALTHPAFPEARQQANVLKQLVAALRLPDEATGKRPQRRGPRGAQRPSVVSSLDRARAKSGA